MCSLCTGIKSDRVVRTIWEGRSVPWWSSPEHIAGPHAWRAQPTGSGGNPEIAWRPQRRPQGCSALSVLVRRQDTTWHFVQRIPLRSRVWKSSGISLIPQNATRLANLGFQAPGMEVLGMEPEDDRIAGTHHHRRGPEMLGYLGLRLLHSTDLSPRHSPDLSFLLSAFWDSFWETNAACLAKLHAVTSPPTSSPEP